MSTSPSADISIIFVCRLVFILIFVLILLAVCISTSASVRISIIANLYLIFSLHYYANLFIRFVSVSMVVLVLVQISVLMR